MDRKGDKAAADAADIKEQRRSVLQHPDRWPIGWAGFEQRWGRPDQAEAIARRLDLELGREIAPGHPLAGRTALAIGKKSSTDDVLFAVDGGKELAVVHLTWTGRQESPPWPWTTFYDDFESFADDAAADF